MAGAFYWTKGIPRTTVRYRAALRLTHGLCNRSLKGCNLPFGKPPLFESLIKYKKIKKGINPFGAIPF